MKNKAGVRSGGFTLVAVLVASFVGVILMMSLVKMMATSYRTQYSIRQMNDFDTIKSNVKAIIGSETRCRGAFRDERGNLAQYDEGQNFTAFNSLYLQNNPFVKLNDDFGAGIRITKMGFEKTQVPTETLTQADGTNLERHFVKLEMSAVSKDGMLQQFDPQPELAILVDTSSHQILGCDISTEASNNTNPPGDGTVPVGTTGTMKSKVLLSWLVTGDPAAQQGSVLNPRYVSKDITDTVKSNCQMQKNDGSFNQCYLYAEVINQERSGKQWSAQWRLSYSPLDLDGNQKETLFLADDANDGNRIALTGPDANNCVWKGPDGQYTICERHANGFGTWLGGSSGANDVWVSVDRKQGSYAGKFQYQLKIVRNFMVPDQGSTVSTGPSGSAN